MIDNNELQKKLYNKDFRKKLIVNPEKYMLELGYKLQSDVKVKVVKSSKDIFYLSVNNKSDIDINEIQEVIAGTRKLLDKNVSTLGTIGTLGSVSSLTGCTSSLGTMGTLGSSSSVDVY